MPEKSLSDRIAERLGQNADVTNRNRNWIEENADEVLLALRKFTRKNVWMILREEGKISCTYSRFTQLLNNLFPESKRNYVRSSKKYSY